MATFTFLVALLSSRAAIAEIRAWQPGLRVDLPAGQEPLAVALRELEDDSGTLVVAPGSRSNTIAVFVGDHHGAFTQRPSLATGRGPCGIAIGDVDRDGQADLGVVNRTDGTLGTYHGDGAGGFVALVTVAVSPSPFAIAAADFDGDGIADFAVADNADHSLRVAFGDGSGGIRAQVRIELGSQPFTMVTADLNLDARADLIATTGSPGLVHVLLGDGHGGFAADRTFAAGESPEGIATGDADGDGLPDVALTDRPLRHALVLVGDGLGGLASPWVFDTDFGPRGIAIGDLDGDSRADLAVTNVDAHTISIFQGRPGGNFAPLSEFTVNYAPQAVLIDDVDRDGMPDLLADCSATNSVAVLFDHPGVGLGFRSPAEYPVSDHASSVVTGLVADVDGDHRVDLTFTRWDDSAISILHGDGTGSFAAPVSMATDFSPRTIGSADLNHDGYADLVVANGIRVSVWLGGPGGAYTFKGYYPPGAYLPIKFADMNGDGKLDLIASRLTQDQPGGIVNVMFGDGTGAFPSFAQVSVPITSWQDFPDLNGDGVPDIAALYGWGPSIVSVRIADGHGGFGPEVLSPTGQQGQGFVMSADVNGDGHTDVIVSTGQPDSVVTMLGDGTGHLVRAGLLVAYGTIPGAQAIVDVTGDGRPDFVSQPALSPPHLYIAPGDGTGRFLAPWTILENTTMTRTIGAQDLNGDGRNDLVFVRYYDTAADAAVGGALQSDPPYETFVYVSLSPTLATLAVTPGPALPEPSLVLTAGVRFASSLPGMPQGVVTFFDGATPIASANLANGIASATVPWPLPGPHSLKACYGGGDGVLGASSGPVRLMFPATVAPRIRTVDDQPGDEGGQLRVRFSASRTDYPGSDSAVVAYAVYNGTGEGGLPVAVAPAHGTGTYEVIVPSAGDSSCAGRIRSVLVVRAQFADGRTADSAPDSGYSVDDSPPAPPAAVGGSYQPGAVHLHWTPGPSPDVTGYRIYRGGVSSFDPAFATLLDEVADTAYVDAWHGGCYYKVTAVDRHCNEGDGILLSPAQTTGVEGADVAYHFALTAIRPNPVIGERLHVEFELGVAAPAWVTLFDLAGRRIVQHEVGAMGPGRHAIELLGGTRISPGVYLLQFSQGASAVTRRVVRIH